MNPASWGVIGAAVGALASIGTTWLTNLNNAKLQANARLAQRTETQRIFQQQALLELQDAFHDAVRLLVRVHTEDCRAEQEGSPWGSNLLPEELDEDVRQAYRRVKLLAERVIDGELRKSINEVMFSSTAVSHCKSKEEARLRLDAVLSKADYAIEQSGMVLRALLDFPVGRR